MRRMWNIYEHVVSYKHVEFSDGHLAQRQMHVGTFLGQRGAEA